MKRKRSGEQSLAASKEVASTEAGSKEMSKKWVIGYISEQDAYPNHLTICSSCETEVIQNAHYRIDSEFRSLI